MSIEIAPETALTSPESRERAFPRTSGSGSSQATALDPYDPGCDDPYCRLAPGHDGPHSHIRGCKCRSCTGKRNRRAGKRAQNRAFRSVGGVEFFPGQISEEERWSAFPWAPGFRWEVKSGAQVPAWVTSAIRQVEAMTPDARPGLIIKPKGSTTLYALVRLTDLADEMGGKQ